MDQGDGVNGPFNLPGIKLLTNAPGGDMLLPVC